MDCSHRRPEAEPLIRKLGTFVIRRMPLQLTSSSADQAIPGVCSESVKLQSKIL
jgi:hypothetical protein